MVQSPAKVIWKTLIFGYNQNEIESIRSFAESRGAIFVSEQTSRWGDESLKPTENLIDTSRLYDHNRSTTIIEPQCESQEYISADGYYWPCCLITSMFTLHRTPLWQDRNQWKITDQNLDQARHTLRQWKQSILDDPDNALDLCKMHCKPGQNFAWASM